MKHIFLVHSSITYLMSLSILNHKKIDISDVIIFSDRPFDSHYLPIKVRKIEDDSLSFIYSKLSRINFPKFVDRIINNLIGEDKFIVYMQSALPLQKVFMTHPKCHGFHFFEEGTADYQGFDTLELLSTYHRYEPWRMTKIKDLRYIISHIKYLIRGFPGKFNDLPGWPYCYFNFEEVEYYCYSDYAFRGIPASRKIVLDIIKTKEYFTELRNFPCISNSVVWIGEHVISFDKIDINIYINGIKGGLSSFFKKYPGTINKIFIKFHPQEYKDSREKTIDVFKNTGINFEIIPDGIPMEILFMLSQNCQIIGLTSSLLYYASLMEHNVYSIINYVKVLDIYPEDKFGFYWERIQKI